MIPAIILAAGNGARMGSSMINKVALSYVGKPMIQRAVESVSGLSDPIFVVVGAYKESVLNSLKNYPVTFVDQEKRLGTGHAVSITIPYLEKYHLDTVLIGNGDHMMLISKIDVKNIIDFHKKNKPMITIVTTKVKNPHGLGRIIKDKQGLVISIVEEKDADDEQKKINLINTGLYCFDYNFLKKYVIKIQKSKATGEYYLTDLIMKAADNNLPVLDYQLNYKNIGGGVNTLDQLNELELESNEL